MLSVAENHKLLKNTLPSGYRFRPTDEEIITHYLRRKIEDPDFKCRAVVHIDLYNCEPYQLFDSVNLSEDECYFFTKRVRRYPTGTRSNRATKEGYWKTTGRDKEISSKGLLVGMKKTLVFYQGRAPTGMKSNWIMHEYRLQDGEFQEWVVCRVFKKGSSKLESGETATTLGLEVLSNRNETVSNPTRVSFSHDSFRSNCNSGTQERSNRDYNYINDNRWLPLQQVVSEGDSSAISSASFGNNLVHPDKGKLGNYYLPQSNQDVLQKPFLPGYPANILSNTLPQHIQNRQLPTRVGTEPALLPDDGSGGNYNPHLTPPYDSSGIFGPHRKPYFDSNGKFEPHCMPNFNSSGNLTYFMQS